MEPLQYENRGYLREDLRLFHLADSRHEAIAYHYHNFHKIIWLLAGRADHAIEGRTYHLQPGDCVLVGRGCIHRPLVESGDYYERMVLYISPAYLREAGRGTDLGRCFDHARETGCYVYHREDGALQERLTQLEEALRSEEFAADVMARALFIQLLVEVNRMTRRAHAADAASGDRKMLALLGYLGGHLTEELSIDDLARRFYISKYHMMRRFREATGYTIHSYVTEKRLLLARDLLSRDVPLTEIAERCGYRDYSTFSRAYKKKFGKSPSQMK